MDRPNAISLHFDLPDRCIQIHNLYNLINIEEISIKILILKRRQAIYLNEEHIILEDFNFYYEAWKKPKVSKTLIKKPEKLLIII